MARFLDNLIKKRNTFFHYLPLMLMQLIQSPLLQRGSRLQEMSRFRLRFEFHGTLHTLPVEVTADSNYLLFLNGVEVGRGPGRHFAETLPVNRHDLASALREGENILCALVRHLYVNTFGYLRGEPAFGLAGTVGEMDLSTSNPEWRVSRETGFHSFSPRVNMHLGCLEDQSPDAEGLLGWTRLESREEAEWIPARPVVKECRALIANPVPPLQRVELPLSRDISVLGTFPSLPTSSGPLFTVPSSGPGQLIEMTFSSPDIRPETEVTLGVRGLGAVLETTPGHTSKIFPCGHHAAEGSFHCRGADLRDGVRLITCDAEHVLIGTRDEIPFAVQAQKIGERGLERAFDQFRGLPAETVAKWDLTPVTPPLPLEPIGTDCLYAWNSLSGFTPLPRPANFTRGQWLRREGLVLDLGRFRYGHYQIHFATTQPTQVEIGYGHETTEDGTPQVFNWDRVRLPAGKAAYHNLFTPRGARYLFLSTTGECQLESISVTEVLAPLPEREQLGTFRCNDPEWNRIWDAARETIRYSRIDVVSSDSFREFCAWLGDTHWIGRNYFYSFFSPHPLRYTWELYARGVDEAGRMPSVVPSYAMFNLPVWTWQFWMGTWEYYLYTGDLDFLNSIFDVCLKTHSYYQQFKTKRGTLLNPPEWRIVDWAKIDLGGESFVLNAIYRRAVSQLAQAACALGRKEEAPLREEASQLLEALSHPRFEDPHQRLFLDGLTEGRPNTTFSQHAQILAYDLGLWNERKMGNLIGRILTPTPRQDFWTLGEPSFHWAAEILRKHPDFPTFGKWIHDAYQHQMEAGATCLGHRHPGPIPGEYQERTKSPCHGWASSPLYLSGAMALGVTPAQPGYRSVRVAPRPLYPAMTQASGTVPTLRGAIQVSWQLPTAKHKTGFIEVTLPPGMEGQLDLSATEWQTVLPDIDGIAAKTYVLGPSRFRLELSLPMDRPQAVRASKREALTVRP
ncbi:MAG: hypothetical protein B9S32_14860 [Verrucomicrobia bacterium Tous-C9LFEB]|nr:MAG: hypothetical protein B9S32_14860 [Verrucomicrobia bacterium Tous-C9LFEB]